MVPTHSIWNHLCARNCDILELISDTVGIISKCHVLHKSCNSNYVMWQSSTVCTLLCAKRIFPRGIVACHWRCFLSTARENRPCCLDHILDNASVPNGLEAAGYQKKQATSWTPPERLPRSVGSNMRHRDYKNQDLQARKAAFTPHNTAFQSAASTIHPCEHFENNQTRKFVGSCSNWLRNDSPSCATCHCNWSSRSFFEYHIHTDDLRADSSRGNLDTCSLGVRIPGNL